MATFDETSDMSEMSNSLPPSRGERMASLEKKALSVAELAKRFELGLFSKDEEAGDKSDSQQGRALLSATIEKVESLGASISSQDAVSEVNGILENLGELLAQWDKRDAKIEHTMIEANKAVWEFRQLADSMRKAEEKGIGCESLSKKDRLKTKELEKKVELLTETNQQLREELSQAQSISEVQEELRQEQSRCRQLQEEVEVLKGARESQQQEIEALRRESAAAKCSPSSGPKPLTKPGEFQILGRPMLGGMLRVADESGDPPVGVLQWSRKFLDGSCHQIAGACRTQYSPDPMDVGCVLTCSIGKGPDHAASTRAPVMLSPGLEDKVKSCLAEGTATFNIVIVQLNGEVQVSVHGAG
mmetsp:Transcript_4698/g.11394  ORF Transcript_4698/g.11394 Transcript_4698/m.11394 type:complete len:359 (-) Transcript_4698:478-1554(-)